MEQKTIFITGGAGYVGAMLADHFSKRDDVRGVVCLDKEPMPEFLASNTKLVWVRGNTADAGWQDVVRTHKPEVVIHTAWQIREMYGDQKTQWHWNIDGSNAVFDFALSEPSVTSFVHFSSVASYGAFPENTIEHAFTEDEPLRKSDYLYAEEKRIAEENLLARYEVAKGKGTAPHVVVIRPAAITGPRGRNRTHFGLQTALSGGLKGKSFLGSLVSLLVAWVPVTPTWLRQYIHEDDLVDIIELVSLHEAKMGYEVFNVVPPGAPVLGRDMARAVGKRALPVYPWMVRLAFFVAWHLTWGRIPTSRGVWKGYSYPIRVDGSKITKEYGFNYTYESFAAFTAHNGRYANTINK